MLVLAMEFSRSAPEGAEAPLGQGRRGDAPPQGRGAQGRCHSLKTEQRASTSDQLGVPGQLRREPALARQYDSLERR
jgi:hypothetical protein